MLEFSFQGGPRLVQFSPTTATAPCSVTATAAPNLLQGGKDLGRGTNLELKKKKSNKETRRRLKK